MELYNEFNNPSKRRIKREVQNITDNFPFYEATLLPQIASDENIYVEVITPKMNSLIFTIPPEYPFKPPTKLMLNGSDYRFTIKQMPNRIDYLYYHPNDMYYQENSNATYYKRPNCLCCSSLLCHDNWSPCCTLGAILNQVSQHNILKQQILYRLLLKPIFDKYNLPVEMIRCVFQYL
jgi:hypothetical protein